MDFAEMKRVSAEHAKDPQPGDYWHEMFSPQYLVIEVGKFSVVCLHKKVVHADETWTWNTRDILVLSRQDFRRKVHYSDNFELGTWCMVVPNWKHWREFAEEATPGTVENNDEPK